MDQCEKSAREWCSLKASTILIIPFVVLIIMLVIFHGNRVNRCFEVIENQDKYYREQIALVSWDVYQLQKAVVQVQDNIVQLQNVIFNLNEQPQETSDPQLTTNQEQNSRFIR